MLLWHRIAAYTAAILLAPPGGLVVWAIWHADQRQGARSLAWQCLALSLVAWVSLSVPTYLAVEAALNWLRG